jgi:hypothetical protein
MGNEQALRGSLMSETLETVSIVTPATGEMSHGCVPFFRKSIFSKRPESAYEPYEDWSA